MLFLQTKNQFKQNSYFLLPYAWNIFAQALRELRETKNLLK